MTHAIAPAARLDRWPLIEIEDRCSPMILEGILGEAEPLLRRAAATIAEDFPAVADDLVQEGRITLWQLDIARFPQHAATYLVRLLCTRMIDVYRHERRGGLTSGWSKHRCRRSRSSRSETLTLSSHG